MTKALKLDSGYHGEISVGKPSYKKVTVNGVTRHVHVVDSDTWKNIKEQLGIVEGVSKKTHYMRLSVNSSTSHHIHCPNTIIQVILSNKKEKQNDN